MTTVTLSADPQRDAARRARYEHLTRLFGVQFPPDTDDGMTEADWQECQRNRDVRNWQVDEAQAHR